MGEMRITLKRRKTALRHAKIKKINQKEIKFCAIIILIVQERDHFVLTIVTKRKKIKIQMTQREMASQVVTRRMVRRAVMIRKTVKRAMMKSLEENVSHAVRVTFVKMVLMVHAVVNVHCY